MSGQPAVQPPGEQHSRVRLNGEHHVGDMEQADVEAQGEVFTEVELSAASVRRSWLIFGVRDAKTQQGPGRQVEKNDLRSGLFNNVEPFDTAWQAVVYGDERRHLGQAYSTVEQVTFAMRGAIYEAV